MFEVDSAELVRELFILFIPIYLVLLTFLSSKHFVKFSVFCRNLHLISYESVEVLLMHLLLYSGPNKSELEIKPQMREINFPKIDRHRIHQAAVFLNP